MNHLIANVFTGLVTDENEKYFFVQKDGVTFRLDKTEGEFKIGDAVRGFAYPDNHGHLAFTTKIPKARIGHFAFGEVTGSRRDLGVFIDIGLPNKDVVLSLDDLPTMKELWPKKGDRLNISLKVDNKDRIWAELASESIFKAMSRIATQEMKNKNISGTVYRLKLVGTYILTDDFYIGFIHPNERYQEPRLGEHVQGRVIGVRPDGVLNISLKPRAYEAISDDAQMIMTFLERSADGSIPYTDKTDPETIKSTFGISKGQFKRALGNLMKNGKVKQVDGKTVKIEE